MAGTAKRGAMLLGGALWLLAGAPAGAQGNPSGPTYKCGTRNGVVYTQVPCAGGEVIGAGATRRSDRYARPPQDRALAARRAQLPPEQRQECSELDARMKQQAAALKAKGPEATIQDETPLIKSKLRFRELKC